MVKARSVGWSNFDIVHGFSEILDVQGLQAMADQAIAIQYLEDRFAPLWITKSFPGTTYWDHSPWNRVYLLLGPENNFCF